VRAYPAPITIACISDTHNDHNNPDFSLPDADILIHAGDFTAYGKREHADSFNAWLGTHKHRYRHIIVVHGNHESNAMWSVDGHPGTDEVLSNATFLKNASGNFTVEGKGSLLVHGTDFYWSMDSSNPHYDAIDDSVDVLICHGPIKGYVDNNTGCKELRRIVDSGRLRELQAVVSGHIHNAYGAVTREKDGVQFVNAANCGGGERNIAHEAIVIEVWGK
jgi:predicted phosphodiesterase